MSPNRENAVCLHRRRRAPRSAAALRRRLPGRRSRGADRRAAVIFADQPVNASRVAELGAGLAVAPPDPGAVAEALLGILEDDSYTLAAERVAEDYRSLPSIEEAARLIEELADRR